MTPKVAFLDCDGVIFDTNRAKARAFVEAVEAYPADAVARFDAYQRAQGGVSRYVKFRHFFETIHPVDDVEGEIARALTLFAERSVNAYRQLSPRLEALQFADACGAAYVVSGADQTELRRIFARQGIADRFVDVLGSPTDKPAHVELVLAQTGVDPRAAVFIGDGRFDYETARGAGMPFIFLEEMSEWLDARDVLDDSVLYAATWQDALDYLS